jgi:hypothetical protein
MNKILLRYQMLKNVPAIKLNIRRIRVFEKLKKDWL